MNEPRRPEHVVKDLAEAYAITPRQAELRRVAVSVRAFVDRLVATEAPIEVLTDVVATLDKATAALSEHPQRFLYEGVAEVSTGGDPFVFFDDSPMAGRANPLSPPIRLGLDPQDDGSIHVTGDVRFGSAYEGPPGHVHGGFIAAAFDELLGATQATTGMRGLTGTLSIRYRNPTPLRAWLKLRGWVDRVEGRKIYTKATLHHDDTLCAESEGVFIAVDFERIKALAGARDASRTTPG